MTETMTSGPRPRTWRASSATLAANRARGDVSVDEITADLRRVRAYAGLDAVAGPGVTISVSGPIDGPGVQELINELRNAGAEAIGVGDTRVVTGVVVTGAPGAAGVDGTALGEPVRDRRHRCARQADRVADPLRRRHRPARRDAAGRRRDGHTGRSDRAAGDHEEPPARRTGVRAFDTLTRRCLFSRSSTLLLGDVVRLRRTHPCGGDTWLVDRLGADIGLRCQTCGRHVLLERATLERRLAGFESPRRPPR